MTLALPEQYSSTTDQSLSSTALKPFTITIGKSTDGSPTCKTFTNKDGVLDYNVVDVPARSAFREEPFNVAAGLSAILDSIEQDEYVILGVAHQATDKTQRLTSGNIIVKHKLDKMIAAKKDTNNTVSRTRSCFEPANIVLFDLDGVSKDIKDVIPTLRSLHPALAKVPMIARASSSYGVHLEDTIPQAKKLSAHVYMLIEAGASTDDYKLFGEILGKLCWLKGLDNHIQISTDGKMLVRQLIDVAVFSPERYSFEAAPILKEGVTRIGKPPVIIDEGNGVPLNIATITDQGLTAAEEATYSALVTEAKRAIRPETELVSKADTELKIEQAVSAGVDREQAKRDILASKRDGHLYPSQRVHFDDNGWLSVTQLLDNPMEYDHATCADPLEPDYNGGRNIAVFYANLNTNTGEFNPIIYTQAHGGKSYKLLPEPIVSPVSDEIRAKIATILNTDIDTIHQRGLIDDAVVERMLSACWFNPSINKLGLLNDNSEPLALSVDDSRNALPRAFGNIYNKSVMRELIDEHLNGLTTQLSEAKRTRFIISLSNKPIDVVIEILKFSNQRKKIEYFVDPFIKQGHVTLNKPNVVRLILPYKPVKYKTVNASGKLKDEVIDDYGDHFIEMYDFLEFVVGARFAPDRKNAFLWLHADSDWGKNFLVDTYKKIGLTAEISTKELEKMFEGAPVGRTADEFIHSPILVFDEVKRINSETKLINNRISSAAKFESTSAVEVYAKVFLSAELIPSLVGEQGLERQFANRFSYINKHGSLNDRELFQRIGRGLYHEVITEHFAIVFEEEVQKYISLGKDAAEKKANDYLDKFHTEHGIDLHFSSIEENIESIVNDIDELLRTYATHVALEGTIIDHSGAIFNYPSCAKHVIELLKTLLVVDIRDNTKIVLKSPVLFVEKYLDARVSHSSKGSLSYKHSHIVSELGTVGVHRLTLTYPEQTKHRGVLLHNA